MAGIVLLVVVTLLSALSFLRIVKWIRSRGFTKIHDIQNKCVLITGCGSGFGLLAADHLSRQGFQVFATCRTKFGEDNVRERCGDRVKTYCMDVTSTEDLNNTYDQIKTDLIAHKGLWGLINNAGVLEVGPIDWQPMDAFKRTAEVNLWGAMAVTKTFLPLVKIAKGRVVNIGSNLCRLTLPYMASYTITKYGLDAFTDALRREMKPWGIHVINIEAGGHKTKLTDGKILGQQWLNLWNELDDDIKQDYEPESGSEGAQEMLRFDTIMSSRYDDVVDAIVTSLTARNPKPRYLAGLDAKAFMLLQYLPTSFMDWLISLGIKPLKPRILY